MKTIGLTSSRIGLTEAQKITAANLLDSATEVHHGDCVGGDADLHKILTTEFDPAAKIVIHPPINERLRAFCTGDEVREPLQYLERDQEIVNETEMLLAFPRTMFELRRSGVWATVRMARKAGKPVIIIWPDGNAGPGDKAEQTKENRKVGRR